MQPSVVPLRIEEASAAREALARDGAVVLASQGADAAGTIHAIESVLAGRLAHVAAPVEVRAAGGRDRPDLDDTGHLTRTPLHTDGFHVGTAAPDVLGLGCAASAPTGGDSFLVDALAVVDGLAASADPHDRELATFLVSVAIDHSPPDKDLPPAPIVVTSPHGDRRIRRSLFLQPAADDPEPQRTKALIARWTGILSGLEETADRFRLVPGDVLVVDNTRCFHGRDPYDDRGRLLWRIWAWTVDAERPSRWFARSDVTG